MKRNGYRPSHRNRWLLVKEGVISRQVFLFWEYCLDQMLFDKRNEAYGTAEIDFDEVMSIFRVTSPSSVRDWYKELKALGLITVVNKKYHRVRITNCDRYIEGGNGNIGLYEEREYKQSTDVIKQSIGFNNQPTDENNQSTDEISPILLKSTKSKALSSFKVGLGSETRQEVRTIEEYREICKGEEYSHLTPEDMQWIDENQRFDNPIKTRKVEDMSDQEIDDIFVKGGEYSPMSR